MTIPAAYQFPPKEEFLRNPIRYLDDLYTKMRAEIYHPSWRISGSIAVAAGLNTITVNGLGADRLPYRVMALPDWNTTVYISAGRTPQSFTLNFGTAAPGGGGNVEWLVTQEFPGP